MMMNIITAASKPADSGKRDMSSDAIAETGCGLYVGLAALLTPECSVSVEQAGIFKNSSHRLRPLVKKMASSAHLLECMWEKARWTCYITAQTSLI